MARCIVCAANGMDRPVDEQEAKQHGWVSEYEGKTYYEDSDEHHGMFEREPGKFVRMAEDKGLAD